jgi:hypothetical protein
MTRLVISIVIVALALALCHIEAKLMLHRTDVPDTFVKLSLADAKQSHEFRIAFKQHNLDILEVINNFRIYWVDLENYFNY